MKYEKYESSLSTTISTVVKGLLLIADLSKIDKEIAKKYIDMCENKKVKELLLEKIENCEKFYFFNRLNVPNKIRGLGLGKELLEEVIKYCDEKNIFLINTANNSGDMGQSKLVQFYINSGMKLIHEEGLLIYYSGIDLSVKKKPKI